MNRGPRHIRGQKVNHQKPKQTATANSAPTPLFKVAYQRLNSAQSNDIQIDSHLQKSQSVGEDQLRLRECYLDHIIAQLSSIYSDIATDDKALTAEQIQYHQNK